MLFNVYEMDLVVVVILMFQLFLVFLFYIFLFYFSFVETCIGGIISAQCCCDSFDDDKKKPIRIREALNQNLTRYAGASRKDL